MVISINEITFPMVSYSIPSNKFVPATIIAENGSALIASYMIRAGFRPAIYDFNTPYSLDVIMERGKERFKDYVTDSLVESYASNGVKIAAVKLHTNGFHDILDIHREVKERLARMGYDLKIVVHGPHANWYGDSLLDIHNDVIDVVSVGDGELTAVPLVKWAYHLDGVDIDDIPNIIFNGNGRRVNKVLPPEQRPIIDLNDLPTPTYSEDVYPNIRGKVLLPMLDETRGCWYGLCTFCAHPYHMGKYRERNPDLVVSDIKNIIKETGVNHSRLVGSMPRPEYINELLSKLPEGHKTAFFGKPGGKYDSELMKGNVGAIFLGLETIRGDMLKLYNKPMAGDVEGYKKMFAETVRKCKDAGICTTVSVIMPSPGETKKSIEELREYIIKELGPDFVIPLPLGILPNTPLNTAIEKGRDIGIKLDKGYHESFRDLELDLLKLEGFKPPYQMRIDDKYTDDFMKITRDFAFSLMEDNIWPVSDELVIMRDMIDGGLNSDQTKRREQVNRFAADIRKVSGGLDYRDCDPAGMIKIIEKTRPMGDTLG